MPVKGESDYKNSRDAIKFQSPPEYEIELDLPNGERIRVMGIKQGITVILGDAYQGKSTLMSAIYEGVYNHIKGDGREYVITCDSSLQINAQNGRSIQNTDISFYISNILLARFNTPKFSTVSASGSTSQAAAVVEAIESGCQLMLFDEDNCANNFMYKENRMRDFLQKTTTTPFIDMATDLYTRYGISSIVTAGASAAYLDIADQAFIIRGYELSAYMNNKKVHKLKEHINIRPRTIGLVVIRDSVLHMSVDANNSCVVRVGNESVNVAKIVTHASNGQINFIAYVLKELLTYASFCGKTLREVVDFFYKKFGFRAKKTSFLMSIKKLSLLEYMILCRSFIDLEM